MIQPRKLGGDIEKLNAGQRMFVENLLASESFNATAAAKAAGYKSPAQAAFKLLKQKRIKAIIGKALRLRIERCQLTADAVLDHLKEVLYLDPLEVFEETKDGSLKVKALKDIPEEVRRCCTKIKTNVTRLRGGAIKEETEVEFMSKDAALAHALKHLGLVEPDQKITNVSVSVDLKGLLEELEENRDNVVDGEVIERIAQGE